MAEEQPVAREVEEGRRRQLVALKAQTNADYTRGWSREANGLIIRELRDRLDALMNPADGHTVRQRPEDITTRLAGLLEEAQRQGLVVTGQEIPPETQALKQHKRMGY